MAAAQQQQQLHAEIGRKLDDVFDSSVILPLAQSYRYRVPVARTTFAVAAEPGRIEDANKQLSDDVAALTSALLSSAHLTEVLAQSHTLRELHTQLASSLSSSKKDASVTDTNATSVSPPDLLVFSLRALVPTLVALAGTSATTTINPEAVKIFESVADLVAKQVSISGGSRAMTSYGSDLNTEVAPLFALLTAGVVAAAPSVQSSIAEILLGIAILRGSPREILSVALCLSRATATTNVSGRLSGMLRSLIEPKEIKKVTPVVSDEKVDEKETDEQKTVRLRAVEDKRRRDDEARQRREDRDRRRRDPKQWPWHPQFVVESFAPSMSAPVDGVERKAGLPTLTSRVASLLLLQQLERNEYPDEQAESHRYPQRVSLRAANGLTISFYTQDKSLRGFYSSSEPTVYQTLDLEWTDDGRKVTLSSRAKSGSEVIYYPNDSENLSQWSAAELKAMAPETRGIQLSQAQFLVVRPDASQPHKIGLRSAKHGWWLSIQAVEGGVVNGVGAYDKEKCLFTVTSMDAAAPWGGASPSASTFEPMTMELHPDTFASLAGIVDASSSSLVGATTSVASNSDACTLLSALNVLKYHLTRYTSSRQMVGELTPAAIEQLQQLFFTVIPARVLKFSDIAIRTAVENALIVAILAGLDLFFPKSWMQLSFLGRELEKKDKSSLETRLCESLLTRFTEFSSHVRLVTEMMALQQSDLAEAKRGIAALDSMVFGLLNKVMTADGNTSDPNIGLYQRVLTNFQRALLALSSVTLPSVASGDKDKKDEKESKSSDGSDTPLGVLQLKFVRTVLRAATASLDATTKAATAIAAQAASPVSVTALSNLADGLWRGFLFTNGRPMLISLVAVINSSSPSQLSFILRLLPLVADLFKSLLESEKAVVAVFNKNKPKESDTKETKGETKAVAAAAATPVVEEKKVPSIVRAPSLVTDEKRGGTATTPAEEAPPANIEAKAHTHTLRYETVLARQCSICNQLMTAGGYTCTPCDWSMCMTCFATAKRNGEVRASAATEAKVTEYKFDKARVREALRERKYPVDDNAAYGRFTSRWEELDPQGTGRVNKMEFMARVARDADDGAEGKMRAEKQWALVVFLLCQRGPEVRPDDKDEITFWEGLQSIAYPPGESVLNEVRDLVQLGRAAPQAGKEKAKSKMPPVSELAEDKDEGLADGHVDDPQWRWLYGGLSYAVAYLSGRATGILASVAPLRDGASASDKSKVQNWLESRLFAGGLDGEMGQVSATAIASQAIPSSIVATIFSEQKITIPDVKRAAATGGDMDEASFLQSLVDMKTWDASAGGDPPSRANNLIAKLDKAVRPAVLQQSVKEGANHATRAIFAALLKHSSQTESPTLLAMADSRQPLSTPPTDMIKKLWEKASQIKPLIAQKKGQGADIPAYVATVVAKCKLLLTVAIVAPPSSGAPGLQRAVSVGEVLAAAKSSSPVAAAAARPAVMDRTVSASGPRKPTNKRVKRTARILISVIWRVMESCQKLKRRILARNVPTASQPWRWGKKGTAVNLTASLLAFVRDETVAADDVYASLSAQRSVALMRYAGIRHLSDLIAISHRPKLVAVALSQLSDSLRATGLFTPPKAADGTIGGRAPEYLGHFMDQLPALGPIIAETLTDSYFGLVSALLRAKTLSNSNPHVQASLLSLANIDLTPADMQQLTEVSMLSFIAPLISFATESSAGSKLGAKVAEIAASGTAATPATIDSAAPWNVRFGAFTLFRLLSYLSSASSAENAAATPSTTAPAAGSDAADAQKLTGLLVDQMWSQISSIITIRTDFAAIAATKIEHDAADAKAAEAKTAAAAAPSTSPAATTSAAADLPPISLEGWSCGACTFINGLEANKCAICETSRPVVSVAPSSGTGTGTGTATAVLAAATTAVSAPGIRQWNEREARTRLQQSAVGWYQHNLADVGLTGKPYATPSAAISELNLYINQFMWIILRVVSLDSANNNVSVAAKLASDPDWLGFLLSAAAVPVPAGVVKGKVTLNQPATTSRAIAAAVLRRVLPLANLSDDKKSHTSQSSVVNQLLGTIGRTSLPSAGTVASATELAQRSELIFLIRSLLGGKGEGDKQFQKGGERADAAPSGSVDSKEEDKAADGEEKKDTLLGGVWPQSLSFAPRAWRDACETELKSSFTAIAKFKDTPAGLSSSDQTIIRRAIAASAVMGAHIEQLREGGRVLVKLSTDDVAAGTLSHLELNPSDNNGAGPRIVVRLDTGEVQRPTSLGELKPIDEVIPSLNADGMDGIITSILTAASSFVTTNPPTSPCSPAITQLHRRLLALLNAIVQLPNFSSRFPSHSSLFPTIGLLATSAIADGVGTLKPLSAGHAEARIAFLEQPAADEKRPTMVGSADAPSMQRAPSLVVPAGSTGLTSTPSSGASDVSVVPVPEINGELWKQWRDGNTLVTMVPGSLPESDFTTEGNRAGDTRRHHMKRTSNNGMITGVTKARADVSVRAGCWYYEVHISNDHNSATGVGWCTAAHDFKAETSIGGQDAHSWIYMAETRDKMFDGKKANYGIPAEDEPNTVGVLLNFGGSGTSPEMRFFCNGRDQGIAYLEFGAVLYPYVATSSTRGGRIVFSADEFKHYAAVQKLYPDLVIRPLEKVPLTSGSGSVDLVPYADRAFLLPCRQGVSKEASSRIVDTMADQVATFTNAADGNQVLSFPSAETKSDSKAKPNDKGITLALKLARPSVARDTDIITIGKWNGATAVPGSSAAVRVALNSGTGAVTITAATPDARVVTTANVVVPSLAEKKDDTKSEEKKELAVLHLKGNVRVRDNDAAELIRRVAYGRVVHVLTAANNKPDTFTAALSIDVVTKSIVISAASKVDGKWTKTAVTTTKPLAELHAVHTDRGNAVGLEREWGNDGDGDNEPNQTRWLSLVFGDADAVWHLEFASCSDVALFTTYFQLFTSASSKGRAVAVEFQPRLKSRAHPQLLAWCDPRSALCDICYNNIEAAWNTVEGYDLCIPCFDKTLIRATDNTIAADVDVALTIDTPAKEVRVYVAGDQVAVLPYVHTAAALPADIAITTSSVKGKLSQVATWNAALTPEQVRGIHVNGLAALVERDTGTVSGPFPIPLTDNGLFGMATAGRAVRLLDASLAVTGTGILSLEYTNTGDFLQVLDEQKGNVIESCLLKSLSATGRAPAVVGDAAPSGGTVTASFLTLLGVNVTTIGTPSTGAAPAAVVRANVASFTFTNEEKGSLPNTFYVEFESMVERDAWLDVLGIVRTKLDRKHPIPKVDPYAYLEEYGIKAEWIVPGRKQLFPDTPRHWPLRRAQRRTLIAWSRDNAAHLTEASLGPKLLAAARALSQMGFDISRALDAVAVTGGDTSAATAWLLQGTESPPAGDLRQRLQKLLEEEPELKRAPSTVSLDIDVPTVVREEKKGDDGKEAKDASPCQWCDEKEPTIFCAVCNKKLCTACDTVLHKSLRRREHVRAAIGAPIPAEKKMVLPANSSFNSTSSGSNPRWAVPYRPSAIAGGNLCGAGVEKDVAAQLAPYFAPATFEDLVRADKAKAAIALDQALATVYARSVVLSILRELSTKYVDAAERIYDNRDVTPVAGATPVTITPPIDVLSALGSLVSKGSFSGGAFLSRLMAELQSADITDDIAELQSSLRRLVSGDAYALVSLPTATSPFASILVTEAAMQLGFFAEKTAKSDSGAEAHLKLSASLLNLFLDITLPLLATASGAAGERLMNAFFPKFVINLILNQTINAVSLDTALPLVHITGKLLSWSGAVVDPALVTKMTGILYKGFSVFPAADATANPPVIYSAAFQAFVDLNLTLVKRTMAVDDNLQRITKFEVRPPGSKPKKPKSIWSASSKYGPSRDNEWDDTKDPACGPRRVLRAIHLRASASIDGIQLVYGDEGDSAAKYDAPYHGGSGSDRWFYLEPGEYINQVSGAYGEMMVKLKFTTTKGRSQEFGQGSGNNFVAKAPEGKVLHHCAGFSDGYLNSLKLFWGPQPVETFAPGLVSNSYGTDTGNPFDDSRVASGKVLRALFVRSGNSIDGMRALYGDAGDPTERYEAEYHGGGGTDHWFRLDPGEHIVRITGTSGGDHMNRLRFFTNRGRSSEQFGNDSGTDWTITAPEGHILYYFSGKSDGYLCQLRAYFRIPVAENFPPPGTISQMYGSGSGNAFDDGKAQTQGKVLRTIHLRASTAVDGIQCLYGEPSEAEDSIEMPYHGGSGTDRWFRLEPGEHVKTIEGGYGSDHIEKLVFVTTRGRRSEDFGSGSNNEFKISSPEGKVLHHVSGKSDGYLNTIRFHFGDIPVETFAAGATAVANPLYGPTTGNTFDDGKQTKNKVLRTIHLRASAAIDGIQMIYGDPSDTDENLEMPYHGGSGNDQYFRLEAGEHVKEITGTYGTDHMERLRFRTNKGRESPQYGSGSGTDFKASAPEGKVLHHVSGRSDGYLCAIKFWWSDVPDEKFVTNPNVTTLYGAAQGRPFNDEKEAKDKILRQVHVRASNSIDGIQMVYVDPSEPSETIELDYHGGSGNDQWFRMEPGEHITKVMGTYDNDHMEQLKFFTNRGRSSDQFGSNGGTSFAAVAPDGLVLRHIGGRSDGYLNAIKLYWGLPLEEKKAAAGDVPTSAVSELFGPERGDQVWSDTKEATGRIIRSVHVRASAAIDGIQMLYGEPGDPSESCEARYHGGSGSDQYFRLEPGEAIIRVTGTYGPEHMERLQFFTNRSRSSPQFGNNTGTDFEAKAPTGLVLHKISGRSDGYLNAIRFHWKAPIIETLPPAGTITAMYGSLKQNQFNDGNIAKVTVAGVTTHRHLRRVHCKASASIDGIQFFYSEPSQREESYETPYHGGSGNDQDFKLDIGEHIVQINLTYSSDHMEKLRFTTNKGRNSQQFGSRSGTDVVVKAPAGMCLSYCAGRNDGYLNALGFYFRPEPDCKDWGVEKSEEELKLLWSCGTCTLLNPLTLPVCSACGTAQPEKLAPGAKEEKDVPVDWFESLIDFIVTAAWLVKPVGAPPLQLFKKVKAKYDELEYEYDLNPDELVKLVDRFTASQDFNLMRLVNKARDNKEAVEEIVDNIFTSPTAALSFGALTKDQVKMRYYVLSYFNDRVRAALPFVDLSRPDSQSILAAAIRSVRHLLFNSEKGEEWRAALERSKDNQSGSDYANIDCNMFRANKLWELKRTDFAFRHSYLGQFYRFFAAKPEDDRAKAFRVTNGDRAWKVKMIGLNSIDAGGPYRDAMEHMCQELHAPVLPLFVPCSNARSNNGEGRDRVVPRPLPAKAGERALRLSVYEFVGRLMGLAMRSGALLALNFPSLVWKHLASQPITHDDVRAIDLLSFQIIDDMREMAATPGISDSVFDTAMADVKFEVYDAAQNSRELVTGGKNISVTWDNRQKFCEALLRFRLSEFEVQCEAIRRGLATVVPVQLLSLYTWQELEAKIAGSTVDCDLLEQATEYKGVNATDPHVQLFWQMMRERFTDEQRSRFISFVWGRSRLPTSLTGFGSERFKITPHGREDSSRDINKMLPVTHTCFFSIELPRYTNLDAMTDRMTYAMMTSTEIDGDGTNSHGVVQDDIGEAATGESLF